MRRLLLALSLCLGCPTAAAPDASPPAPTQQVDTPAPSEPAAVPAAPPEEQPPTDPAVLAQWLADKHIIVDGHVDLPWRLYEGRAKDGSPTEDVTAATTAGDFDWPRAKAGGLDAPFMSIYVPSSYERKGAKAQAELLIDMVEALAKRAPDKFALARTPADVRKNTAAGLVSLPMGMENGAPIEGDLANVTYFHGRGIRYITLTHSKDNHISDSSYDNKHTHGGLSKFGREVVAEMNRVGIMVDVSHLSDQAFWHVMETTKVPVIASHSSCRHFTPGYERNMSDEMLKALAKNGGVVMINFGSGFLGGEIRKARSAHEDALTKLLRKAKAKPETSKGRAIIAAHEEIHPAPRAKVEDVADHIEHVIALVGVDHVGLGSDFDGVGDSLPDGIRHVGEYPNLVRVLLARGRSAQDIEKILGGNALRVWQAVEDFAAKR
jgi:membrane dipeptidase